MLKKIATGMMLTLILASTMGFTATCLIKQSPSSEASSTDWWSMFRHDANHTGYSTSSMSISLILLQPPTPFGTGKAVKSSPTIVNDVIYACSLDGYVYALNTKPPYMTTPKWKSPQQFGDIYSSPAVAEGKVYFGSDDKNITALDASNGTIIWSSPTEDFVRSSPVIADGVLYVGSFDGYVYALNASTGSKIWKYRTASPVESSPTIFGDTLFFGSNDTRIYALEKSGKIKWFNDDPEGPITSSPAVADGKVFVGSWDNKTYAFDIYTGKQVWNYTTNGPVVSSPSVAYGRVFIGSNDTKVYALNAETGIFNWSFATGKPVTSSPAVADGRVFVGSNDRNIYAINATTGNYAGWGYGTGGPVTSSPAIANGILSIGSDDRYIYAFTGNRAPIANFTFIPKKPVVTQQVTFNCLGSYDPDSNSTGDHIDKWEFDFGDGTVINRSQTLTTVTHAYSAIGEYNANLTVWDTNGENDTANDTVTVCEAWPMFHHDPTHASYSTSLAPSRNDTLRMQVGQNVSGEDSIYPSPAVVEDLVFMSSTNGTVYALYTNGTVKWARTPASGKAFYASPAFIDGLVYAGCTNGYVYAWRATDGALMRNTSVCSPTPIYSSLAASGSRIFVGSLDWHVYAIDRDIGAVIEHSPSLGGAIESSPAIAYGMVFVGSHNGSIYALNETALSMVKWNYSTNEPVVSSPTVAYGMAFIGSGDNCLYAINATTGKQKWNFTTGGAVDSSPAVADGVVFVGSKDGKLYAVNATDGMEVWSKTIGAVGWSSPAVADGKVFIGTQDGQVCALSVKDGTPVWSYQTDGRVESSPAIFNDSLYVGSQDGYLYAFHSEIHDVAILNVTSVPNAVIKGGLVNITVALKNEGAFDETSINVTVSYDSNILNYSSVDLDREEQKILVFLWNTSDVPYGNYTISANATLPIDDYPANNNWTDGIVSVTSSIHNIAVTYVNTSKAGCPPMPVVCGNYSARVFVTVENRGNFTETFNVTAYCNDTAIILPNGENYTSLTLTSGSSTVLTFVWNAKGFAKGNYTIWAYASPVPDEADPTDNTCTDGVVAVVMDGDVNWDAKVDVKDVYRVAQNFGKVRPPGVPSWDRYGPNCDINDDDKVDTKDYYIVCKNYGKVDP